MERASTPDHSSNWDWESAISKYFSDLLLKSASLLQYFIYRYLFQYFWAVVVAEVEALYYI